MIRTAIVSLSLTLVAAFGSAHEASLFHQAPNDKSSERRQIVDKLRDKYKEAADDLNKQDTSAAARAKHDQIVDLIDELLKQQNDPPPSSNPPPNSDPPPSGNDPPPSKEPPPPSNSNPPPRTNPNKNNEPMSAQKPAESMPKSPQMKPFAPKTEELPKSLEHMKADPKGQWPSLPPRERGDIDAYRRTRFVPGYESLLGEYYRRLAESRQRDGD